jgi:hypothetical protein
MLVVVAPAKYELTNGPYLHPSVTSLINPAVANNPFETLLGKYELFTQSFITISPPVE